MTTPDDDLGRLLGPWFRQTAPEREPDGLLETVLARTARTKRRSRWLIADTWRPEMAIPQPATVPRRALWLAVAIPLIIALTIGLVAIGSQRRLPPPFGPARAGLLAFDSGGDIVVAASDGTGRLNLTSGPAVDSSPSWSLDGRKIAFWRRAAVGLSASLWVMNADGSHAHDVTGDEDFGGSENFQAVWSPESKRLAFSVGDYYSSSRLYVVGSDGSDLHEVGADTLARSDPAWSPDGRLIAFRGQTIGVPPEAYPADPAIGIWVVAPDGTGQRRVSVAAGGGGMPYNFVSFGAPLATTAPSWSPDGRTLVYATGPVEHHRIAIGQVVGDPSERILALPERDALMPSFSPDGTRIAYIQPIDPTSLYADAFVVELDGTGREPLPDSDHVATSPPSWAPDGASVLVLSGDRRAILPFSTVGPVRAEGSIAAGDTIDTNSRYPGAFQRVSWQRLAP
jgi:Tol biopolymer transport system component